MPTKYGGFCAKLAQCGKSRSLQKVLESKKRKMGVAAHFEIVSLESLLNLKKEGNNNSSPISLEFAIKYRKVNTLIKILKLLVNCNMKKHCWDAFNNKIVATGLKASMTAFLW